MTTLESRGRATESMRGETLSVSRAVDLTLMVTSGPDAGKTFRLRAGSNLVGVGRECDIQLHDRAVSRQHLDVIVDGHGNVRARDLGSKNGSYVLGLRLESVELSAGMRLQVGHSELALVATGLSDAELWPSNEFGILYGDSPVMRRVFATLDRLARTSAPVLITGETGTGKEMVAQAIHSASRRGHGPFEVVDIAGLSPQLIESELFGHVRGAYTGAMRDRRGAFANADTGTVFLDEIGEMPLSIQPRLLRALEARQVKPVGGSTYLAFDARLISATHRDLHEEVRLGRFREDLLHRLVVAEVWLPPLRARRQDIPGLVERFVARITEDNPLARNARIPPESMAALAAHSWPGNLRQLRNVIERACALLPDDGVLRPSLFGLDPECVLDDGDGGTAVGQREEDACVVAGIDASTPFKEAKERLVEAWEKDYLSALLRRHAGQVSRAAAAAGIDRVHLHRLLRKHGFAMRKMAVPR
jgi:DNA-binding NtrC family response regulator